MGVNEQCSTVCPYIYHESGKVSISIPVSDVLDNGAFRRYNRFNLKDSNIRR